MILLLLATPIVGAMAVWFFRYLRPVAASLASAAVLLVAFVSLAGIGTPPFVVLGRTLSLEAPMRAHIALAMLPLALVLASSLLLSERDASGSLALLGLGLILFSLALQSITLAMLVLQAGLALLVMLVPHKRGDSGPVGMRILATCVMGGLLLSAAAWLIEHPGMSTALLGPMALVVGICLVLGTFPFFIWQMPIYRSESSIAAIVFGVVLPQLLLVRLLTLQGSALPAAGGPQMMLFLNMGIATFVVGCIGALAQQSISGALGYMAIGELGVVLMALGSDAPGTQELALLHLILRGLAMVGVSVAAAVLRRSLGSDYLTNLRGAFRRAPITTLGILLAGLSLAGFPPMAGFFTRFSLYRAIAVQDLGWAMALAAIGIAPALTVARFGIVAFQVAPVPESRKEPLWPAWVVLLVGLALLTMGLAPQLLGYLPAEWRDLILGLAAVSS